MVWYFMGKFDLVILFLVIINWVGWVFEVLELIEVVWFLIEVLVIEYKWCVGGGFSGG